ncbi:FecR family protein [Altererythrobacter sp.]|uniref:FecR family protein n=1 Tax=Altererythrobacter sp. TaxID=1872480 RepID=UPI003CFF817F
MNPDLTRIRRNVRNAALCLATASLAISAPLGAQERVEVGIAAQTAGDVRFKQTSESKARKIQRKERLAWGNVVSTKDKSQLQILLLDRSSVSLGGNAQMQIDRFVYDPGKERSFVGRIFKGAFRFMSGLRTPSSTAQIESPSGSIGIRGTVIDTLVGKQAVKVAEEEPFIGKDVRHDKKTATFVLLRGPGPQTVEGPTPGFAEVSAAGETVTLDDAGLAAYIPRKGAAPIGPFRITAEGMAKVQDRLQPRVANARGGGGILGPLLGIIGVGVAAILLGQDSDGTTSPSADVNPNNSDTAGRPPIK